MKAAPYRQTQTERVKHKLGPFLKIYYYYSKLYFTDIFICHSDLKGLLDKIVEHLLLLVTGATQPNDFADLCWFLQRDRAICVENKQLNSIRNTKTDYRTHHYYFTPDISLMMIPAGNLLQY